MQLNDLTEYLLSFKACLLFEACFWKLYNIWLIDIYAFSKFLDDRTGPYWYMVFI